MRKLKVAVLMSTYNGEKYIREQIDSILNQEGDFELQLIVRDDGSKDDTLEILREYQKVGKLIWYSGENLKSGKSFLDILYKFHGFDYYAFSDQDDVWENNKLKVAVETIRDNQQPCLYFSNVRCVDSDLKPLGINTYHRPLKCDFYSTILYPCFLGCTMVFNHELAEIIQGYRKPMIVQMHDSFIARVCVSVGGLICYDEEPHMLYRQHGDNVIGAVVGKKETLKNRVHIVFNKDNVGIAEQIKEIVLLYDNLISPEKMSFLKKVSRYNDNLISKCSLILDRRPKYMSLNIGLTMKLRILLGNL